MRQVAAEGKAARNFAVGGSTLCSGFLRMRPVRRALFALLTVAALAVSAPIPAFAQGRLTLSFEAPQGCPGEEAVRAEVGRLLGGALPEGPVIEARGEVTPDDDGFALVLRTRAEGDEGERSLTAPSCAELAQAAALILALMIDPDAVAEAEAPPAPPEPEPSPVVRSLPAPAPESRPPWPASALSDPASPVPPEPPFGVGALVALEVGTLPTATIGVAVEGLVHVDERFDARLAVGFFFPQSSGLPSPEGAGAEISLLDVWARGCVRPWGRDPALGACLGLHGGALFGRGFGVSDPASGTGAWAAVSGGLAFAWRPVPVFELELTADLAVPFWRDRFVLDRLGTVHVPDPIAGRFALGAHFNL